jgi:hypothetical protein
MEQATASHPPVMSDAEALPRKTYHAPVLRVHGTLGRLTQGVGTANGDAGQNMMS